MLPVPVDSGFDVAFFFIERAHQDAEYLQPQKMHRLMYLAQAYYAVANRGRRLIPGVFVADAMGPIEPTLFRAFENGRPVVDPRPVNDEVRHFLDSIWRRFGSHTGDYLTKIVSAHPPFQEAAVNGPRTEITLQAMMAFYGRKTAADGSRPAGAPDIQTVLRPKVMRSAKGRPVNVTQWMPRSLKDGEKD